MTVEEFTLSYFTLGSKIDWLTVTQPDGNGNAPCVFDSNIGETIYMKPEIRNARIRRWWIDTKAKKIIAVIEKEDK